MAELEDPGELPGVVLPAHEGDGHGEALPAQMADGREGGVEAARTLEPVVQLPARCEQAELARADPEPGELPGERRVEPVTARRQGELRAPLPQPAQDRQQVVALQGLAPRDLHPAPTARLQGRAGQADELGGGQLLPGCGRILGPGVVAVSAAPRAAGGDLEGEGGPGQRRVEGHARSRPRPKRTRRPRRKACRASARSPG